MSARRVGRMPALLLGWAVLGAHVGSPTILVDGDAGPYPVRVIVRPPGVIPGQAEITVRALGDGVRRVTVRPVRWDLGLDGAPRPDAARRVAGDAQLWSAELWLMEPGSYSVQVAVEGDAGSGTLIVAVPARATERLGMDRALGAGLLGLGGLLFAGALSLVGAAVRESVLPPGERPGRERRRRARRAMAGAAVCFLAALFGGWKWWESEDGNYLQQMARLRPFEIATETRVEGAERVFRLAIVDPRWTEGRWTPLVPDHGKLMHLFLVREPQLDAFAHLHPVRRDSSTFEIVLPPLPAGRYRVYADVVHESGFAHTLTSLAVLPEPPEPPEPAAAPAVPAVPGAMPARASSDVPASPASPELSASSDSPPALDPDDSWYLADAGRPATPAYVHPLADGSVMRWERDVGPLRAGEETTLRFSVAAPDGSPARLEPYMGMLGHAAVTRDDGSVFVHLHPVGTVSMTAQQLFEQRLRGDTTRSATGDLILRPAADGHARHGASGRTASHAAAFPYEFPQPGRYRIWVQVKREGRVLTGTFDAEIAP